MQALSVVESPPRLLTKLRIRGMHEPALVIVLEQDTAVCLVHYKRANIGEYILPQGKILEDEKIPDAARRILKQEFNVDDTMILRCTTLCFYHQNFEPRGSIREGKRGKGMFFAHVRLASKTLDLHTQSNTSAVNPPVQVEWVQVENERDLCTLYTQYLARSESSGKCWGELEAIAQVRGVKIPESLAVNAQVAA